MSLMLAVALVFASAVAQLALEAAVGFSAGVPLLPTAVLAAWARTRGPIEAWAALAPAAILIGVASEARAGWVVLALLPTPLLACALPRGNAWRSLAISSVAAGAGAAAYLALLAAPGVLESPGDVQVGAIARSAGWTALGALVLAVMLLPFRPRERGLFS